MSRKNARRISHIFLIFPNYAYYESAILCGHYDTHIVDFKLFFTLKRFLNRKIIFPETSIISLHQPELINRFESLVLTSTTESADISSGEETSSCKSFTMVHSQIKKKL